MARTSNKKWFYTLAEIAKETLYSVDHIQNHRIARSFAAIYWRGRWVVPNSSAEEFIRLVWEDQTPSIWEAVRNACSCEKLPKGAIYSVTEIAQRAGLAQQTVRQRIRLGKIKAYYYRGRWWLEGGERHIRHGTDKLQTASGIANPRCVADQVLKGYFTDHENVEFLDCAALSANSLKQQLNKLKADEFFIGRKTQLQDGTGALDLQKTCGNVRFTQI